MELKKLRGGLSFEGIEVDGSDTKAMQSSGHNMNAKDIRIIVFELFITGGVVEWRGSYLIDGLASRRQQTNSTNHTALIYGHHSNSSMLDR